MNHLWGRGGYAGPSGMKVDCNGNKKQLAQEINDWFNVEESELS